jgi:ribonuclease BN (tRNA processing enzyme)
MATPPRELSVIVLGTASCTPEKGGNTASFVVGRRVVLDAGWYLTDRLLAVGISPLDVEAVCFTHCHHDHIIGLPQILFYWGISGDKRPKRPFHVYGPAGEIRRVVDDAFRFLQFDRYPELRFDCEVHELRGGARIEVAGLKVATCSARHTVPGLGYRFENEAGASAVFSGDTAFNPDLTELARGVGLLVHEASYGARSVRDDARWGHSGAPDAAEVARQAGVARLAIVHCGEAAREAALDAARAIFPASFVPRDGEEIKAG